MSANRKRYVATRDQAFRLLDAGDGSAKAMLETELLPQANDHVAAVAVFGQSQQQGAQAVIAAGHAQAEVDQTTQQNAALVESRRNRVAVMPTSSGVPCVDPIARSQRP